MQQPQQPTVIQAEQAPDNLLIGDLLSLDIPTGPAAPAGGGGGGGLGDLDLLGGDFGGLNVSHIIIIGVRGSGGGGIWTYWGLALV